MFILSTVVIILIGIIAFYHSTEGFFSAVISAIAAVLAAVLAVSYLEPVVPVLLHGVGADSAHSIGLVLLFIVGYAVIRLILDKLIPGNVRTPSTVDKVGAVIMGLVAGTFAVGILVLAWEMLPFNATMNGLGYTRYAVVGSRDVIVHEGENKQADDSFVYNQMVDPTLEPDKQQRLWVPADDWVLNTVYHLSNGGSLAGARSLASVHPDWLSELFGQRLGMQTGNRRVALAIPGRDPVGVGGVYAPAELPGHDGYGNPDPKTLSASNEIRPASYKSPYDQGVKRSAGLVPLVVRVTLRGSSTDDTDKLFRFSLASIRLTTRPPTGPDGTFGPAKDYYPIGTLEDGKTVITSRADDFLFAPADGGFDAVFMVDPSVIVAAKNKASALATGTFITVKRLAVLDLSGLSVEESVPTDAAIKVLRPSTLTTELHPQATR